jgi:hypothetical protein
MTLEIMFESLMTQGTKIDNLWSMYIVVQLGVFWFFFLLHRPLLIVERLIALLAYTLFTFINGSALVNSYLFLEALRADTVNTFRAQLENAPFVYQALVMSDFSDRPNLIFMTHGGALVFVVLILLFRNSMISYYYKSFPPTQTGAGQIAVD